MQPPGESESKSSQQACRLFLAQAGHVFMARAGPLAHWLGTKQPSTQSQTRRPGAQVDHSSDD